MRAIIAFLSIIVCSHQAGAAPLDLTAGRQEGETPKAVATGPNGSVYVAGSTRERGLYVLKLEANGQQRVFTSYLAPAQFSAVEAIAVDRVGNAYIVGHTESAEFPVFGSSHARRGTASDIFLAKIDAKGNWQYSTVLGGAGNDVAHALAIDRKGTVYVTGWTSSHDFPAEGERVGEMSGFVAKFRGADYDSGSLFSFGQRTMGNAIAVDSEGATYIAGSSEQRGKSDAFLLKLNNSGERVYRNVLTGSGDQVATSVALADDGSAWISGWTSSADFPVTQTRESGGGRDAFLARFDAQGDRVFSKVVGGRSDDEAHDLALDSKGNVYIAGTRSGESRSFVAKLSPGGDHEYLSEPDGPAAIGRRARLAVDSLGNAILAGTTIRSVATCRYRLSKALHHFDPNGGAGSASMDAPEECAWNAESTSAWISVTHTGGQIEFHAAPNYGGPRAGSVVVGGQTLVILQTGKPDAARSAITGAIRANTGFQTSTLGACDDGCSSSAQALGFSINFFGISYNSVFVNNNGNITFGSANTSFSPNPIPAIPHRMIAAFWADVDTRGTGSGQTRYGQDIVNGRKAFGVNWIDVGYYSSQTNKLNSMQIVLIDRGDLGAGFFDIELNYASIQWETGSASGGSNGLGGTSARAGFTNGTNTPGTNFELPGSGVNGAFLNGGSNSLVANSTNSAGVAGRYVYNVRAGSVVCGTGITTTSASVPATGGSVPVTVTASNPTCTWSVASLPTWITVSSPPGGNGTGNGAVTLQVAANSGGARSAVISVAGQTFTVTQAGTTSTTTCPPYTFSRAAVVNMLSGNTSQGSLAGLERLLDGTFTLHNFTGNSTNFVQTSTPNYQQSFTNCIGRPTNPPAPLGSNYRLFADTRGQSAVNPIVTDLMGNGLSSSVGLPPYSLETDRMQVVNATANKTPGTRQTYAVPANARKLLSSDLNNDNRRDIVVLSQGATGSTQGVLSVFPGNGDGTLGTRRDHNVGNGPQSATLADFNGDNRLDAAVANTAGNNLMILMGNGDNSFQTATTLTGDAPGPRTLSAADVNKDNRQDLIIGHSDGVDVRLGNGNGTFQAPVRLARGFVAHTVGSGDFNKDGNPDVAVSSEAAASAMIVPGNGNGSFRPPKSYVTKSGAGNFFVSDFDGDGNSDMVFGGGHPDGITPTTSDSNIMVIYGQGNGALYGPSNAVLPSLADFTIGDFNDDGNPDVLATAPFANTQASVLDILPGFSGKAPVPDTLPNVTGLQIFTNDGSGTLSAQTPVPVPGSAPAQLFRITSADFNGDGRRDVAVNAGIIVHVLTGNGSGGFNTPNSFVASSQITSIAAGDVNGDGRQDLVFTDEGEDRVSIALGVGDGTFQTRTVINHNNLDPKGVAVADVNADGRPDLIVVNFGTQASDVFIGGISVLLNSGNGAFQPAVNIASGQHPTNVTIGDVNLDGKPDIVTSTGGPNGATLVAVHLGNGNGTFQTPTLIPVAFGPAQTALTDFNGDGKIDILVGHCCGDVQMGLLLGNGNGTFVAETTIPNTGNGSLLVSVADMNRDSKPDVVFGASNPQGGYVATLLNSGSSASQGCTYTLSQSSYTPGMQAQTLNGTLTTTATTCNVTAQSFVSWLSISPSFAQGQTVYSFTINVQANPGTQRTGTVSIGGQTITVTQSAPPCPYNLSPGTLSPPPAGGSFTITVGSIAGCPWSISGVPSWVAIQSPLNSSGPGTISLTVTNNPGPARIANLTIAGRPFAITQAGTGPAGGLRFSAVEPCRLLETRAEYNFEGRTGVFGPPFFNANETRTLPLPSSSVCRSIPANAKAYVLNVTLVPNGPVDFVTVYPAGETRPDFWTVRSLDGLIVANSAIVAAGTGAAINVFASNAANIIIDISGYFTDDPVVSNLVYYPLTPCRVIETRLDYRQPPGPFGPPTMNSRETRNFRFPNNGYCNVPTGAAAYAATITVVPPGPLAFLTAWPEGRSQPNVSSMNSPAGRVLANSVIIPASPDGGIQLFTFDRSDVIVDITGYFGPDDGSSGLFYFPVRQCRISQTNGAGFTGPFNGPIFENETSRTIPIPQSSCAGIPGSAKAYSLNATVMPGGSPMPFLTIYPSGQARPNASVINAFEGQTVSSGFLVVAGTAGAIDIFAFRRTHVALEISGYFNR